MAKQENEAVNVLVEAGFRTWVGSPNKWIREAKRPNGNCLDVVVFHESGLYEYQQIAEASNLAELLRSPLTMDVVERAFREWALEINPLIQAYIEGIAQKGGRVSEVAIDADKAWVYLVARLHQQAGGGDGDHSAANGGWESRSPEGTGPSQRAY